MIFCLARVIRCAIVVSWTRNARAIWAVVRPHTTRSVSAICACRGSAGWQQVKISRSRSSGSGLDGPLQLRQLGDGSCVRAVARPGRGAARP